MTLHSLLQNSEMIIIRNTTKVFLCIVCSNLFLLNISKIDDSFCFLFPKRFPLCDATPSMRYIYNNIIRLPDYPLLRFIIAYLGGMFVSSTGKTVSEPS